MVQGKQHRITQELFDETVLENQEVFELSPAEALQETVDQFGQQGVSLDHLLTSSHPTEGVKERQQRSEFSGFINVVLDSHVQPNGTILISNDSDRETVRSALQRIASLCSTTTNSTNSTKNKTASLLHSESSTSSSNDVIEKSTTEEEGSSFPYLNLLHHHQGMFTLMSYLGAVTLPEDATDGMDDEGLLQETVQTITQILTARPQDNAVTADMRSILRDSFVAFERLVRLIQHYATLLENNDTNSQEYISQKVNILMDLLRLGYVSCRNCERNKVGFVRSNKKTKRHNVSGGVSVAAQVLRLVVPLPEELVALRTESCRMLSVLCRFDDFRSNSSAEQHGMNVSSVHDHVLEFYRAGTIPTLHRITLDALEPLNDGSVSSSERVGLAAAALTATRVLAVNDEIVQALVAVGTLSTTRLALEAGVVLENEEDDCTNNETTKAFKVRKYQKQLLAAGALGLIRNLCGNDEIKTTLCLGSSDDPTTSVLPSVLLAMRQYRTSSSIQEHGCGTLGAMALRRPPNCLRIIDLDGPREILTAMRQHPNSVIVQRQGCLAVRNLVSRLVERYPSGEEAREAAAASAGVAGVNIRDVFLDLGAEQVLQSIAGRHQGSVDEAYAALRDLGCTVSLLKFDSDSIEQSRASGGSVQVKARPAMFGEVKSNFRPVYDESPNLHNSGL
uniref:Armadillo repeat-containing protein 8 n=1 Tax=Attheya septentrionalis TaxID=420275 RepID=A0A6T7JX00_9STRA|mmetsp:Transcript_7293/g.13083  ORF Transcript_7293/g.13083 Transcript_7293/m.13083 type:complete len:677 (+) Transcript_7293:59-2089(+)